MYVYLKYWAECKCVCWRVYLMDVRVDEQLIHVQSVYAWVGWAGSGRRKCESEWKWIKVNQSETGDNFTFDHFCLHWLALICIRLLRLTLLRIQAAKSYFVKEKWALKVKLLTVRIFGVCISLWFNINCSKLLWVYMSCFTHRVISKMLSFHWN